MAVIYGRRRVGKTSLIKQFLSNKLAIYVQGVQATAETNLRFLSNAILDFEEPKRINRHKTFLDFAEGGLPFSTKLTQREKDELEIEEITSRLPVEHLHTPDKIKKWIERDD